MVLNLNFGVCISLLTYINTPVTLLNSFVNSRNFLVIPLGFLCRQSGNL